MSSRSDKAFEAMQQIIFAVRNKNSKFKFKAMPNTIQVQMTLMAVANVLEIPMADLIDKINEKEAKT